MKILIFCISLCSTFFLAAQSYSHFDEIEMEENSFINGSNGATEVISGSCVFPLQYDETFDFWSGWAVSNVIDTLTAGFTNQYASIAGQGAEGTDNYSLCYASSPNMLTLSDDSDATWARSVYLTNSTYAYLSMRDGDAFAKKFGGETGDDPDFFLLTIKAYKDGVVKPDSIDFYLADYRFDDNEQDYIVNSWEEISLSSLGQFDNLSFALSSSDTGQFGINTPAYFCMDGLRIDEEPLSTIPTYLEQTIAVYPNPCFSYLRVENPGNKESQLLVYNSIGQFMYRDTLKDEHTIDVSLWPQGSYQIVVHNDEGIEAKVFIKE